jgi:hypothetical protein
MNPRATATDLQCAPQAHELSEPLMRLRTFASHVTLKPSPVFLRS